MQEKPSKKQTERTNEGRKNKTKEWKNREV